MKKARLRLGRALILLSGAIFVMIPSAAYAHDGVGGDELATAGIMLVAAIVVALMGALAMLWAFKIGQFDNVEESKYAMLETSEDFDAIMAEADAAAERSRELEEQKKQQQAQPAGRVPATDSAKEAVPMAASIEHHASV